MLTRKQKEQLVKELATELRNTKTAVVCGYQGISVANIEQLRSELRQKEAKMQVLKKTLIKIALKDAEIEFDSQVMDGQVAIVYGSDDEIFAPKVLHEFAKKNDSLKILAGVLEGKMLSAGEVEGLAKLPSKEELLAKVVGTINAPISGFVNVLAGNLRNFVYALNAIKESKS